MTNQLPLVPSIDHLRYQAKNLLELCRVGDAGAIQQLCFVFPAFAALGIVQIAASVRLHHAQDVVARCYGYHRWSLLCESVDIVRRGMMALSTAMEDPRMEDFDYRAGIARSKRLPEIGASRVSEHGVRYDVVDYMPAVSPGGAARVRNGGPMAHIADLLPIISFPEMSDRLYELYIETDTVTSRPILFFDTMPDLHSDADMQGMHQVIAPARGGALFVHFDAARIHETIIAHELGHIWVERVEQKEDYRHPKDHSDLSKITQFYHLQSFVMDLCVNDMLMRRGFDMSVIASDQAQSIVNFAENVANKAPMRNKRVLAAVINALAGTLLEMERFPSQWSGKIAASLEIIQIGLPEAFEPAKEFVKSVLRHGYADSAAIMRIVDECAAVSFAATGDSFDPERDLELIEHSEPEFDKRPEFLSCLPRSCKMEVFRAAAKHGITGRARYDVLIHAREHAIVVMSDPQGGLAEPVRLGLSLPYLPDSHLQSGDAMPSSSTGSAYIPHLGMPNAVATSSSPNPPDPFAWASNQSTGFSNNHLGGFQAPAPYDRYRGQPEFWPTMMNQNSTYDSPSNGWSQPYTTNGFGANFGLGPNAGIPVVDPFTEQAARVKRLNEEHDRRHAAEQYRIQLQNQRLTETHTESYSGTDLKPMLTPPGEEYAKLHPRRQITAAEPERNYMAGFGLWVSRVGFEQQMAGEHPYGYANNNPVTNIDPFGLEPCLPVGEDPCSKYPAQQGFWDNMSSTFSTAAAACPGYNQTQITAILRCIVENESRDKPGGYTFPTSGSGVQGPCQIWPGPDKDAICGTNWRTSLNAHMLCCAKILCRCLTNGGGNLVKGCGTTGKGKNRTGQFQVINQSGTGYSPRFKCCLKRQGIPNPSQTIPTVKTE